jgi:hypothetical protein
LVAIAGTSSCIEPFTPPETTAGQGYLVVDGFLNTGDDTSFISLRRTQNIHDNFKPFTVQNAVLSVGTEDGGENYQFIHAGEGKYYLPPQSFNQNSRYQLKIQLGEEVYQSEFVSVSQTPDIDSLTYRVDNQQNSVVINVNTHDKTNQTRFYRWRFEETYEYVATYYSSLTLKDTILFGRPMQVMIPRVENINRCWKTNLNQNILLGSTIKQTQDAILSLPVNNVPISTNKFFIRYSILVKQYGLTREAFDYWTTLAKTTQGTGSLFDPLPSLVTGNIKNIHNKDQLVFGYFSAGTEKEMRLFIDEGLGLFPRCFPPDTMSKFDERAYYPGSLLLNYIGEREDSVLVSYGDCADCRLKGGTNSKPSYWL